jgi:hypothetical protein
MLQFLSNTFQTTEEQVCLAMSYFSLCVSIVIEQPLFVKQKLVWVLLLTKAQTQY